MMDTRRLAVDSRAVSRLGFVVMLGIGVFLLAGVFVFSGVILDGDTAAEPDESMEGTPESPGEANASGSGDDAAGNETEAEPPERVDVTFDVWEQERGEEFAYFTIRLENESGGVVEELGVGDGHSYTFEDLAYNENYTVVAEADQWPAKRMVFQAGQFERKDLIVGYEFSGADSFQYSAYINLTGRLKESVEVKGKWNDENDSVYYVQRLNPDGSDAAEIEYITIDRTTYGIGSDGDVDEMGSSGWGYAGSTDTEPVFRGLDAYENRKFLDRVSYENRPNRFIGNQTAGKTLDKYEVDLSSHYSEDDPQNLYGMAVVYVDPQSGYVVRIKNDHTVYAYPGSGKDWYRQSGTHIYDFYGINQEYNVTMDDLDVEPPEN